jgi:hypothetical protein
MNYCRCDGVDFENGKEMVRLEWRGGWVCAG